VLDNGGDVVKETSVATTKKALVQMFGPMKHCRIAIEVGTHSPWVSRLLKSRARFASGSWDFSAAC